MNNKEIFEQVIKIAIENGYVNDFDGPLVDLTTKIKVNLHSFEVRLYDDYADRKINFIMLVTSKDFIEAIAKKELKKYKWDKDEEIYYTGVRNSKDLTLASLEELIDNITIEQALAIRDNKLTEFYNNII